MVYPNYDEGVSEAQPPVVEQKINNSNKTINWCDERNATENNAIETAKKNGLWISSEYFSGMNHAPTIRHICRGNNELFYLNMDWNGSNPAARIYKGVLYAYSSSTAYKFTVVNSEPEVKLIDSLDKLDPNKIYFSIDSHIMVFDELNNTFKPYYDQFSWKTMIPDSCLHFSDGCNGCFRNQPGGQVGCTLMACNFYSKPYCKDK